MSIEGTTTWYVEWRTAGTTERTETTRCILDNGANPFTEFPRMIGIRYGLNVDGLNVELISLRRAEG